MLLRQKVQNSGLLEPTAFCVASDQSVADARLRNDPSGVIKKCESLCADRSQMQVILPLVSKYLGWYFRRRIN